MKSFKGNSQWEEDIVFNENNNNDDIYINLLREFSLLLENNNKFNPDKFCLYLKSEIIKLGSVYIN